MTPPDAPDADLAIVGAGAAGLATAIFAGERAAERGEALRIVLLDGAERVGAKILVSGGGRCNVTHQHVEAADYHGPPNVIRNVLRGFDHHAAARWLTALGVELKVEATGKLFPVTDKARTVLDALLERVAELGVELRAGWRVQAVEPIAVGGFGLRTSRGVLTASRVVLATGGQSLPKTGSDGQGWAIARSLGHTVTPVAPALAPLTVDETFGCAGLAGIALPATLSVWVDGARSDRRTGDLLFTHFGLSGPVAMDVSRALTLPRSLGADAQLRLTLFDEPFDQVDRWLITDRRVTVARRLAERLPARLAEAVCGWADLNPREPASGLERARRRRLTHALTDLPVPVTGSRGWNAAEVTAGGVPMTEVEHRGMASRIVPGLHLAGEMLDVDGRIGGFNFQWAWATGWLAGRAAVDRLASP